MDDRELLKLAAKAAGYAVEVDMNWGTGGIPFFRLLGEKWDPIADDGAALRLLVSLTKHDLVLFDAGRSGCSIEFDCSDPGVFESFRSSDPYAATRRAIVRAAAEIGKAMP